MAYRPRRWARTTRGGQVALLVALGLLAASATVIAAVAAPHGSAPSCARALCVGAYRYSMLDNASLAALAAPPRGLVVDAAAHVVQLPAAPVRLLLEVGPPGPGDSGEHFTLYGLTDPTLRIPVGTQVTFVLVNLDDDVHDLALTTQAPPFGVNPVVEPNGTFAPDAAWPLMTPLLLGSGAEPFHPSWSSTVSFVADAQYWYVCVRAGHAEGGMFGALQVGAG